jgi:N12 class adenine-specific DNA methylase
VAPVAGEGKTVTMAATGMKMKQAGLIKKPMYVVPNHLLEQFSREFMQLYPNARLLVAAK